MKTRKYFWITCLVVCLGAVTLSAQNSRKNKKKEKEEAVRELIQSDNYKVDVSMAYPLRGRSIVLTSPYSLEVRNDSVLSWLPFYGRAYSIPYGGGEGLTFKAPIDEYDVSYHKKGRIQVKMRAKTQEDTFDFMLNVSLSGSADVNVTMRNRESISYSGEVDLLSLQGR